MKRHANTDIEILLDRFSSAEDVSSSGMGNVKGADKVDYSEYNKGGKIVFRRFFSFTFIAPDDDDDCGDDAVGIEQRTQEILHQLHGARDGCKGERCREGDRMPLRNCEMFRVERRIPRILLPCWKSIAKVVDFISLPPHSSAVAAKPSSVHDRRTRAVQVHELCSALKIKALLLLVLLLGCHCGFDQACDAR